MPSADSKGTLARLRGSWPEGRVSSRANPLLVYGLGLCPALAVTSRLVDGLAMGAVVLVVLVLSALAAGSIRTAVPKRWKLTAHLVIASCLVTTVELMMKSHLPAEAARMGIYLPLVAVNCAILGQMQEPSDRASIGSGLLDAFVAGLGFLGTLAAIALVRELLGSGSITIFPIAGFSGKVRIAGLASEPARLASYPAGAFIVLGYLKALQNWISHRRKGDAS